MKSKMVAIVPLLFLRLIAQSQDFQVEYDKKADLSHYKTFSFGEGEIITPKDLRRVPDSVLHQWVRKAIGSELTKKGLTVVDSASDLTVTYVVGSQLRSDAQTVGPLGMTPGSNDQSYVRDYRQGSLVIDLNETRSRNFVWRVSSSSVNANADAQQMVNQIVVKGFKKFPKKHKDK